MDQESFRQLLQKPSATSSSKASSHVRGSLLSTAATAPAGKKKAKAVDASQPAFKPRTLKKNATGEAYRDRASERRLGTNNDYAQVEALAEDFERRNAENVDRDAVEEQRKYLGGDSQHTVLVKGLDFALLEQNRARAAAEAAVTDDVSLEQAFTESVAQPKKRTREEILRDLKSRRGEDGPATKQPVAPPDQAFVEAKSSGKFKPIGFKPIGGDGMAGGKGKRKKKAKAGETEGDADRKKKKRKVGAETAPESAVSDPSAIADTAREENKPAAGPSNISSSKPATAPEPEPADEDFDIFADAGEYTGIDLGDDEDGSDDERPARPSDRKRHEEEEGEVRANSPLRPGKWLATSDDEREPSPPPPPAHEGKSAARAESPQRRLDGPHRPASDEEEGEMEEERPMRLQPLSSSVVPSIKDLLAASDEVEREEKRKARKEKKKAGGGGGAPSEKDTKAKVDRDYQRLKAYQDKQNKS